MTQIIDTPEGIKLYSLVSLKYRLKLEAKGMKCRGASASSIVKKRFGWTGNAATLVAKLDAYIVENYNRVKNPVVEINENIVLGQN